MSASPAGIQTGAGGDQASAYLTAWYGRAAESGGGRPAGLFSLSPDETGLAGEAPSFSEQLQSFSAQTAAARAQTATPADQGAADTAKPTPTERPKAKERGKKAGAADEGAQTDASKTQDPGMPANGAKDPSAADVTAQGGGAQGGEAQNVQGAEGNGDAQKGDPQSGAQAVGGQGDGTQKAGDGTQQTTLPVSPIAPKHGAHEDIEAGAHAEAAAATAQGVGPMAAALRPLKVAAAAEHAAAGKAVADKGPAAAVAANEEGTGQEDQDEVEPAQSPAVVGQGSGKGHAANATNAASVPLALGSQDGATVGASGGDTSGGNTSAVPAAMVAGLVSELQAAVSEIEGGKSGAVAGPTGVNSAPQPGTAAPNVAVAGTAATSSAAPAEGAESAGAAQNVPNWNAARTLDGVVLGLRTKLDAQNGQAEIRLDPPNLGVLNVRMTLTNGSLVAQFESANAQVRDLLSTHFDKLRTTLEGQGITVDRLVVRSGAETAEGTGVRLPEQAVASPNPDGRGAGGYEAQGRQQRSGGGDAKDSFAAAWKRAAGQAGLDLVA